MVKIMFVFLFLLSGALPSGYVWAGEHVRIDAPELQGAVVLVADLQKANQLIVGQGSQITVYHGDEAVHTITGFPGHVTALAVGDLTGNFRSELLVGTDNAGAFYVFELHEGQWHRLGDPRYMWAPVTYLQVADVNGDGWGDIIAKNDKGEVHVYLSWEGQLYNFHRTDPEQPVKFVEVADLTGDGSDEIVLARHFGYVAVMKWEESQLEIIWENYPWGGIDGLMVGSLGRHRLPELMVITQQNILYGWAWDGHGFSAVRHSHQPLLGEHFQFMPDYGLVSHAKRTGISFFRIGSQLELMEVLTNAPGEELFSLGDRFLVREAPGSFFWLQPVSDDYLETLVHDDVVPNPRFMVENDTLLVAVEDVAALLGFAVAGTEVVHVFQDSYHGILRADDWAFLWNGVPLPLSSPSVFGDGALFVPSDFFVLLGWDVEYDASWRRLVFRSDWSWWWDW